MRIWDVETGQEIRRLALPFVPQNANFSADDATILVLGEDGKIRFFDTSVDAAIDAVCAHLLRDFTPEEREQYEVTDDAPTCPD